jgi:hypothetical protein
VAIQEAKQQTRLLQNMVDLVGSRNLRLGHPKVKHLCGVLSRVLRKRLEKVASKAAA